MQVKVDFGTLKQNVLLSAVLERYGIKTRQSNAYLRADCPLPSHTSKESKGSFAVNTEKNIWCCKSTSCNETARKKGGDVLDFVSLMEQTNVLGAAKKLLEWFPQNGNKKLAPSIGTEPTKVASVVIPPNPTPVAGENKPLNFELKGIAYHPYLKERGISEELALKFGVGFFPGKGSMSGRVVIPIRDGAGVLIGYAGRSINGEEPKYKLPVGFIKSVLFNLQNVKGDAVTIVEGFVGCMKVSATGFPCVGLMGSTLTEAQEKLLRTFKFVTLMLDPDVAGVAGIGDILPRLAKHHYVRIAQSEKPPDEMTEDEIKNVLRYTCPVL